MAFPPPTLSQPLTLDQFQTVLLDQLDADDKRYAVFVREDWSTHDPYSNDTREAVRRQIRAATTVQDLIDTHVSDFEDFWPRVVLNDMAGLPLPRGYQKTAAGYAQVPVPCSECGDDIGGPRLDALPDTRLCVGCAARSPEPPRLDPNNVCFTSSAAGRNGFSPRD